MSKHGQRHALYTAYEAIKHNRRAGKCVVVLSADVKKAYPTMLRTQMLQGVKDFGASGNLYHAIACMYEDNTSTILTSQTGVTSAPYSVENGLREGAVLSPLLYCVFTAGLMQKLKSAENAGLGMHVGSEWVGAQMWADDQLLMTAHADPAIAKANMEKLMQVLLDDAHDKHYAYNPTKSHVLIIDGTASTYARDGNKVRFIPSSTKWPLGEEVPSCKFLGTVLDRELTWERHIVHRETQAADALFHVRQLASHSTLGLKHVTREWERSVAQSLFYGADALVFQQTQLKRLNSEVARGAALVLGLHHTATPAIAADMLQWRNAEQRVQHTQMHLLWELQHTAPPKTRRIYQALIAPTLHRESTHARLQAWHVHTHALLAEFETANSTRISTASKKEWGDHVQSFLRAAHTDHWLEQLKARVAPTSAVPPPTSQRPQRVCAPRPAPLPAVRTLQPEEFVGEVVTKQVGDDLEVGTVTSYDPHRQRWHIRYRSGATAAFTASHMAAHGPPRTACALQPGTSEHAITEYLLHRPKNAPAWCVAAPALSAYERRHWAKVITSSDLAVCRGKYTSKHGDSSRQLCTCKSAALETIEHFYFECAAYAAVRQPLTDAATEWCKLSAEHAPDMGGFRQALLWAATDSQLLTPNGPNTAGDDLRKRALEFYAKAKAIRHNKSMDAATQPTQSA